MTLFVVAAHGDEPLGAEVHVDLGEVAAERDDVGVVVVAPHHRAGGAPMGLVEGAVTEAVGGYQLGELVGRGVHHVGPGDSARVVLGDHHRRS